MKRHLRKMHNVPTVRRLPDYHALLQERAAAGEQFVSSSYLAEQMGIIPVLVRKDIEVLQVTGTPRIGYPVEPLLRRIEHFLGWGERMDAVLLGVGQVGAAILANRQLATVGLNVVAAFDADPRKISTRIHGVTVLDVAILEDELRKLQVDVAILCVPSLYAQGLTDRLVAAGVGGIWNFTPVRLDVPDQVITQKEDLTTSYALLSARLTRTRAETCAEKVA